MFSFTLFHNCTKKEGNKHDCEHLCVTFFQDKVTVCLPLRLVAGKGDEQASKL